MNKINCWPILMLLGLVCAFGATAANAQQTLTVNSLADDPGGPTAGVTTLRDAINQGNSDNDGDTIMFEGGIEGTISLLAGLPEITASLTIQGPGASTLTIDGGETYRPIYIGAPGETVTIAGLGLSNGSDDGDGMGGGGVYVSSGNVVIEECAAVDNSSTSFYGGFLYNYEGSVNVEDSTIANNSAASGGGAILNTNSLEVTNCTLTGNGAYNGAIENYNNGSAGKATLTNCTLSGNSGTSVGGLWNNSTANLVNCILYDDTGGEIDDVSGGVTATYCDTEGGFPGNGNFDEDPSLDPLAYNGGPTETMALETTSTCLGAGEESAAPVTDQRGDTRPNPPSIGAYDFGYTLTPQPPTLGGSLSPDTPELVSVGGNDSQQPFTASPFDGFAVSQLTVQDDYGNSYFPEIDFPITTADGTVVTVTTTDGITQTLTFTNVQGNYTVIVAFGPNNYSLTPDTLISSTTNGSITPSFEQDVTVLTPETEFDALPDLDYGLINWIVTDVNDIQYPFAPDSGTDYWEFDDGTYLEIDGTALTFTDVLGDYSIDAVFGFITTTALASSQNPSAVGQSVTFTATVTGSSPTGTVQFTVDGTDVGTPVDLLSGQAIYTTSTLTAGTHAVSATYSGDWNNAGSNVTLIPSQVVNTVTSSTEVISSANPSSYGQAVTFTATVTGSSPTGTIQFAIDGTNVGSPVTLSSGQATYATSTLSVGAHTITATYSGDLDNAGSTGSLSPSQVVNKATSSTSVTSSTNPSTFGQSVTFTAMVTGSSPTGTVQFAIDGANVGSPAALSSGQATYATSTLGVGPHTVAATYNGDANNAGGSGSLSPSQIVNKAASATSVTSSANPSTLGQNVTFTATVTASSPTGTIQFAIDGTNVGSPVTLSSGQATYATSTLSVGAHTITATYSGDSNNAGGSGSLSPVQTVGTLTSTTTAIASSSNPSTLGQSVTFTATVTGSSPTGTVQFAIDGTNVGTPVNLSSGQATYSTATLSVGTHTVAAAYGGDTNNAGGSGSLSPVQVVNPVYYEGDVLLNGAVNLQDWVYMGRIVVGLAPQPTGGMAYQAADCAPRGNPSGGSIGLQDWVQTGRYLVGLDPPTAIGGPTEPSN